MWSGTAWKRSVVALIGAVRIAGGPVLTTARAMSMANELDAYGAALDQADTVLQTAASTGTPSFVLPPGSRTSYGGPGRGWT